MLGMNQVKENVTYSPNELTEKQREDLVREALSSKGKINLSWSPTVGITSEIFPQEITALEQASDVEREAFISSLVQELDLAETITVFYDPVLTHP